jgi:hypothetical protein
LRSLSTQVAAQEYQGDPIAKIVFHSRLFDELGLLQQRAAARELGRIGKLHHDKPRASALELTDKRLDQCAGDAMPLRIGRYRHAVHFRGAFSARDEAEHCDAHQPTIGLGD